VLYDAKLADANRYAGAGAPERGPREGPGRPRKSLLGLPCRGFFAALRLRVTSCDVWLARANHGGAAAVNISNFADAHFPKTWVPIESSR
jgi:hypothetical protein